MTDIAATPATTENIREAFGISGDGGEFSRIESEQRAAFEEWLNKRDDMIRVEERKNIANAIDAEMARYNKLGIKPSVHIFIHIALSGGERRRDDQG